MKIIVTGGHVACALALVPFLRKSHKLLFIGRKYAFEGDNTVSFEYQTIQSLKIPFATISTGRLQRRFTRYTIPSLLKFPLGFFQAFVILREFKPDVVLSFGGYVALPVCFAAFILGIPIVIHEQTASKGGLVNRITTRLSTKVCVAFKESLVFFPIAKTIFTGNPIRQELFQPGSVSPFSIRQREIQVFPLVYVTGGSGGSHSINMLIVSILKDLLERYTVIHQVGNANKGQDLKLLLSKVNAIPKSLQARFVAKQFVDVAELAWIYKHASLLVGRSGANTVYEILSFGVPALLIPLPWAGGGEQEANARLVEKVGLGKVLLQNGLDGVTLLSNILKMMGQIKTLRKHAPLGLEVTVPDANTRILAVLEDVVNK